jgi:hypothetical protein
MMVSLVQGPRYSGVVSLPTTVCTEGDTDGHPLAVGSLVILWCFSVFPRTRRACSAWYTSLTPSTQLNGLIDVPRLSFADPFSSNDHFPFHDDHFHPFRHQFIMSEDDSGAPPTPVSLSNRS